MKDKIKEKLRKKYFYALGIAKFEGEYGQDIEQDCFPEFVVDEIIEETKKAEQERIWNILLKKLKFWEVDEDVIEELKKEIRKWK